jgi:chemosensory pili system protein ChpA (sensor histidine kinase/response regulator)
MQNSTTEFAELSNCLGQLQEGIRADSYENVIVGQVQNELNQWVDRLGDAQEESLADALKLVIELNGLIRYWSGSASEEEIGVRAQASQFLADHITQCLKALEDGNQSEMGLQNSRKEFQERWQLYVELIGEDQLQINGLDEVGGKDEQTWGTNLFVNDGQADETGEDENEAIGPNEIEALLSVVNGSAVQSAPSAPVDSEDVAISSNGSETPRANITTADPDWQPVSAHSVEPVNAAEAFGEPDCETESCYKSSPHRSVETGNADGNRPCNEMRELLQDRELLEAFLDDANRCLESIENSLLQIENDSQNSEAIRQVGRELHTLKGASATVGLSQLAADIHLTEELIDCKSELADEEVARLLQKIDSVRVHVNKLQPVPEPVEQRNSVSDSSNVISETLPGPSHGNNALTHDSDSIRIRSSQLDRLMDFLAELVVLKNRRDNHLDEYLSVVTELDHCTARLRHAAEEISEWSSAVNANDVSGSNVMDELGSDIGEIAQTLKLLHKPIHLDNQAISQGIGLFRQEIMKLRRLPVSGMFRRLQRSIRDAARVESKEVRVNFVGEDVGLEHSLQETLLEALGHVVRNAVSHGIETPDQRLKCRKDKCGVITLKAASSGSQFLLRIEDDGRGLDFERICMRGFERGLLRPGDCPTESELAKLIFHPGFSTRDAASEISGRGVGMDVVANVIQRLYGRIDIESVSGKGTTFTISIPLRSGIEHVLIIQSGEQLFAIPTHSVASTTDENSLVKLGKASSLSEDSKNSISKLFTGQSSELEKQTMTIETLVTDRGTGEDSDGRDTQELTTFSVQRIVAPEEVVVRTLPPILRKHPFFDGVTLSGANKIALIADPEKLVQYAKCSGEFFRHRQQQNQNQSDRPAGTRTEVAQAKQVTTALVVDDSLSARRLLVRSLRDMGIECVQAQNGEDALAAMEHNAFAMILTDIDMPRMNGIELIRHIKAGEHKNIPIAVISGRHETDIRARVNHFDGIRILPKPVDIAELKQFVTSGA